MDTWTVLRILFSLLCVKYIFFWWSMEGNDKYAGKSITSAMEYIDLATFTFAT